MMIHDYLTDNHLTRYRFAKMCGLPYGTVNDICTGKTDIGKCSGETLLKIAGVLGQSVDALLHERFGNSDFNMARIKALIAPVAEKYGLRSVYVFGSYARNEANKDSDVDILIDREGSSVHGLFALSALRNELMEVLGKKVDLVTVQSLDQTSTIDRNTEFIDNVMKERVKVYG